MSFLKLLLHWCIGLYFGLIFPCFANAQVQELTQALVRTSFNPGQAIPVELPYNWDTKHPQQNGQAVFEIAFTLAVDPSSQRPSNSAHSDSAPLASSPYALYIGRVGTVYEVWLNGSLLSAQGYAQSSAPSLADYAKAPRLFALPEQILQNNNLLRISLRADAGRKGGLSAMLVGPQSAVAAHYQSAHLWRVSGVMAVLVFSVCVALLCAMLWLTQPPPDWVGRNRRDHLTLWAAIGEGAWVVVLADQLLETPWLAWPQWELLLRVATGCAAVLALLFCYQVCVPSGGHGKSPLFPQKPKSAYTQLPWFSLQWRVAMVLVALLVCICALAWHHFHGVPTHADWSNLPWLAYASTLFGLAVVTIVLARFRDDTALVQDLLGSMTERIAQREQALQRNYAQLELAARAQESASERGRVLRDMHDSVGSHIGLAVRQIESSVSAADVLRTLRTCLDQLKLSIDALQMPAGDVGLLLANLRYRLAPRLATSGVGLHWEVAVLPHVDRLDAGGMRQLQQLIFEIIVTLTALTKGGDLRVQAEVLEGTICIHVLGLASAPELPIHSVWMARASAMGANIRTWPLGAGVHIEIPVEGLAVLDGPPERHCDNVAT